MKNEMQTNKNAIPIWRNRVSRLIKMRLPIWRNRDPPLWEMQSPATTKIILFKCTQKSFK